MYSINTKNSGELYLNETQIKYKNLFPDYKYNDIHWVKFIKQWECYPNISENIYNLCNHNITLATYILEDILIEKNVVNVEQHDFLNSLPQNEVKVINLKNYKENPWIMQAEYIQWFKSVWPNCGNDYELLFNNYIEKENSSLRLFFFIKGASLVEAYNYSAPYEVSIYLSSSLGRAAGFPMSTVYFYYPKGDFVHEETITCLPDATLDEIKNIEGFGTPIIGLGNSIVPFSEESAAEDGITCIIDYTFGFPIMIYHK